MKFGPFMNYYGSSGKLPNLLGQHCTYTNANIWLNVLWSFSPQLGTFGSHPQASGKLLVESLTTPLDRIGAVQLNLLSDTDLFLQHSRRVLNGV